MNNSCDELHQSINKNRTHRSPLDQPWWVLNWEKGWHQSPVAMVTKACKKNRRCEPTVQTTERNNGSGSWRKVTSEKLIHHECQRLPKYKIQKFHILLWNSKTCFIFIGYKQGGGKRLGFNGICESKYFLGDISTLFCFKSNSLWNLNCSCGKKSKAL